MTKPLPSRPSLESLRKQAKQLARDSDAEARIRAHLPDADLPLSQRDALLVIAREYGFAGWNDLREEVLRRSGDVVGWTAAQAARAIHANDVARLQQLIADCPAILAWRDEDGLGLLNETVPFAADVSDPAREAQFFRPDCAAVLIDAGAVVDPSVVRTVIGTGAVGMLALLGDKNALPRTLTVFAARGDLDGVRHEIGHADATTLNDALMAACRFGQRATALDLLDSCIAADPVLGHSVRKWRDRAAFVEHLCTHYPAMADRTTPWHAFAVSQLSEAITADDEVAFSDCLGSQRWLLDDIPMQVELIEQMAVHGRESLLTRFLAAAPAILQASPPPASAALVHAFDHGHAHLVPMLMRIWPLPDDLPHAAGLGNLAGVARWFDAAGKPALGRLSQHYPASSRGVRKNLKTEAATQQLVLDTALAWSCVNNRFETATFLLARGADINTRWSTHEPASILHECALHGRYEAAQFLIDNGIDLTIRDHRWDATAAGWAFNAAKDEKMTALLMDAEERRGQG